jgi:hypothetical protein
MMPPSVSSTGTLESGPAAPPAQARRRQRLAAAVGLLAAGSAVAAIALSRDQDETSPSVGYVESWITAWNDRDAQTVSSMTCDYNPAFMPAGDIERVLDAVPEGTPVIGDHTITGTEPAVVYDRTGVQVHVSFVRGAREGTRKTAVFVRVRDDGDMCVGYPVTW